MYFKVRNFKRAGEAVDLRLSPITVLLGENGAGKTTLTHALAYGHHVVKSRMGKLELGDNWSAKFNIYDFEEIAENPKKPIDFEWRVDEFVFSQSIKKDDSGAVYSRFEIRYAESEFTVYCMELMPLSDEKQKALISVCPAYFHLISLFTSGLVERISFAKEEVEFSPDSVQSVDAEVREKMSRVSKEGLGFIKDIKSGDASVIQRKEVELHGQNHFIEDGLRALYFSDEAFRDEIESVSSWLRVPNLLGMLCDGIDPHNSRLIPLFKHFKVRQRIESSRVFDPSSRIWSELKKRKTRKFEKAWPSDEIRGWLISALKKFDIGRFEIEESKGGMLLIKFEDGFYHFDLGSGQRQIFVLILELAFMLTWYCDKMQNSFHQRHIFVIEEPEVSLHPDAQTKILEVLCSFQDLIENYKAQVKFVVETHSEYFLRRGQLAVKEGSIGLNDFIINWVSNDGGQLRVHEIGVERSGQLTEALPSGFLDESSRLIRGIHFS